MRYEDEIWTKLIGLEKLPIIIITNNLLGNYLTTISQIISSKKNSTYSIFLKMFIEPNQHNKFQQPFCLFIFLSIDLRIEALKL